MSVSLFDKKKAWTRSPITASHWKTWSHKVSPNISCYGQKPNPELKWWWTQIADLCKYCTITLTCLQFNVYYLGRYIICWLKTKLLLEQKITTCVIWIPHTQSSSSSVQNSCPLVCRSVKNQEIEHFNNAGQFYIIIIQNYPSGTLGTVPRDYENEELPDQKHFVRCISFLIYMKQ
jgi:hypothetical protein